MVESASYVLSAYSFIFTEKIDQILDVGYQSREGNPIPSFDENLLIDLCSEATQVFRTEDNTLKIDGDVIIVGDIHGSLHDLLRILKFIQENNSKVLFLGDYVDRGNFSLECITILFAFKVMNPDKFYLIRGNHEFDQICSQYGFKEEILNYHNPKVDANQQSNLKLPNPDPNSQYNADHDDANCYKYSEKLYDSFVQAFSYLPICAILNNTTFCIHGGLSPKLEDVDNLNTLIKRPINAFEENLLLSDVVWGDPSHDSAKYSENPRGFGYLFNREAVSNFLKNGSFTRMIRAHQCVRRGYMNNYNGKCLTVFSASSYDKLMGNSSSVLQLFQKDDTIKNVPFLPLRRLLKSEAVYCKVQPLNKEADNHTYFSRLHPTMVSSRLPRMVSNNSFKKEKSGNIVVPRNLSRLATPLTKSRFITKPRQSQQYEKPPIPIEKLNTEFLLMNMNSAP